MKKSCRFKSIIGAIVFAHIAAIAVVVSLVSVSVFALSPFINYWAQIPDALPKDTFISQKISMFDKNGNKFAETWVENRENVRSIKEISPFMRNATVSAEDKNFYTHAGIDFPATARSIIRKHGGASSITQQLVKNLQYLSSTASTEDRLAAISTNIARKMRELKIALNYEKHHSKNDILVNYLNTIAIGNGNTYGIKVAARKIYDKTPAELDLNESATLAGSINNPALFDIMQVDNAEVYNRVKDRRDYVLEQMLKNGQISKQQYNDTLKSRITTHFATIKGGCSESSFPYYCQYVLDYMSRDPRFGATLKERSARIAKGGFNVYTNLDPDMTRQAENQVKHDYGVLNRVAMPMAVVGKNGAVLAIAQNRDWGVDASKGQTQLVLADTGTPSGSTYKMITLAAALANGWDENRLNQVNGYCPWKKAGFDTPSTGITNSNGCQAFQVGKLGIKKAIAYSSNTYFAELSSEVGVMRIVEMSQKLGLPVPDGINAASASFTLGVSNVTPIEMAAAYATFTNKGVWCPPTPVDHYLKTDGKPMELSDTYDPLSTACRAVLTPKQASFATLVAHGNINDTSIGGRFGEEGGARGHDTAGKSGTSNDFANTAWAAMVGQYTVFGDAYDPRGNFAHPLTSYYWRGAARGGYFHSAMLTVRDFMSTNLANKPNIPLDLNNDNNTLVTVPFNSNDVKIVPHVVGMKPETALQTMKNANIEAKVLKIGVFKGISLPAHDSRMAENTIVEQSTPAGTRLSASSKHVVVLKVFERSKNTSEN